MSAPAKTLSADFRRSLRAVGLPEPQTPQEMELLQERLRWTWAAKARDNQLPPPGTWTTWLLLAGRRFGKTRAGAEWLRGVIERGEARRTAIVAPTNVLARRNMILGESGLVPICPPASRPRYIPSNMELRWPNGAVTEIYSAEEPDRLNGPGFEAVWADELGVWGNARETWNMLMMCMSAGQNPRLVVTTTPKPNPESRALLRALVADPATAVTRGSSYENVPNLAPTYVQNVLRKYEGTRLGREQIHAEMIDDDHDRLLDSTWFEVVRAAPAPLRSLRYWDMAATDPTEQARQRTRTAENDPDYTVGALLGKTPEGIYYILDIARFRKSPFENKQHVRATALRDGTGTPVRMEQEPGSAGKTVIDTYRRDVLQGFAFKGVRSTGSKSDRAVPFATYAEAGHIKVLDRPWTRALLEEFDHFGEAEWHDDQIDAAAGAFSELAGVRPTARPASAPLPGVDQAYRQQQARYTLQAPRRRPGIGIAYR